MTPQTVADYESAWKRLRRLRTWRSVAFPMAIASWLVMLLAREWRVVGLCVFGPLVIARVFLSSRIGRMPCPRCGLRFARFVGRVVDSSACSHCGLKRYEMPAELERGSSG